MSDIVERLREEAASKERIASRRIDGGQDATLAGMLADQAADEIERLREAINTPMRGPEIIEVGKAIHRYIEAESTVHVGAIAHDAAITVANIIRARALKERGDE